jgi:3-oxoacyl-[acyl-carrier protein] reductase
MNKVAVITGASKGIGAATAIAFGRDGYDVVVNYLSDKSAAETVAKTIETDGRKALLVQADVYTEAGIKQLFDTVAKEFGHLDVLVSNAGFTREPSFGEWTLNDITKSFTSMFAPAALCTQAAVPLMENGGSILYTSSVNGLSFGGNPSVPFYSAAKAAVINFTESMAEKLATQNIRCNVVAPGTTKTPFWDGIDPARAQKNLDMTLLKDWVEPEEIAAAFVFLANTPHMSAQTIVVDGGWEKKSR